MTPYTKNDEYRFPPEMIGKIMSYLSPKDIKEWLLLAYFKQDLELVYEIHTQVFCTYPFDFIFNCTYCNTIKGR